MDDELGGYLLDKLPGSVLSHEHVVGELVLHVARERVVEVMTVLRDDPRCLFKVLLDVCGVDWPDATEANICTSTYSLFAWPDAPPGALAWGSAIGLGLVCTALAYVLYFRLLGNVGSSRAVTVTFLIPMFGILWGSLFLGERITPSLLGGCAIVLLGTALATGVIGPRAASARP